MTPTTTGEPEQAGAAMDRLVAEKVMGWPWYATAPHEPGSRPYPHCYTGRRGRLYVYDGENDRIFAPSTGIADDYLVLEHVRETWTQDGRPGSDDFAVMLDRIWADRHRSIASSATIPAVWWINRHAMYEPGDYSRAALAALAATATGAGEGKS